MGKMLMTLRNTWFDLDSDFQYRKQRRNFTRKFFKRERIAAFDTETQEGNIQTFHFAQLGKKEEKDKTSTINFRMNFREFSFVEMIAHLVENYSYESRCKTHKYWTFPTFFAWNLQYDLGCMMKVLSPETLHKFAQKATQLVDLHTGEIVQNVKKRKGVWMKKNGMNLQPNRYAEMFLILKKTLRIRPIDWWIQGHKLSKIQFYDISQFYREARLETAAQEYLGEGKDPMDTALMGQGGPASHRYWAENMEDIVKYGEKDTLLTARLAWLRLSEYQEAGISPHNPLSKASIARNNLFRLSSDIGIEHPDMNEYMNHPIKRCIAEAAMNAYHGGWFSTRGAGFRADVVGLDLVSAYPHVMWWIPNVEQLSWVTERTVGVDGILNYLKTHVQYWPAFVYARVTFPDNLPFYPLSKWNGDYGTVQNPQYVRRWFTADEIVEAQQWNAEIEILQGCYSVIPESSQLEDEDDSVIDGIHYPFRPAISLFYGEKDRIDKIPIDERTATDHSTREVMKTMINSIYGLCLATITEEGTEKTGSMWNSIYAALITSGTRCRIAEAMRLNNHSILSVATDGIILPKSEFVCLPPNPLPIEGWTLGDWEVEGTGDLLLLGSGVYSIINECNPKKRKNTARGHAGRFVRDEKNWLEWCKVHAEETEQTKRFFAPWSMGEARIRCNFSLVGAFREQTVTLRPQMDAWKRPIWEEKPQTFGDLTQSWYNSKPPRRITRKLRRDKK
jgi:hypothetical protein